MTAGYAVACSVSLLVSVWFFSKIPIAREVSSAMGLVIFLGAWIQLGVLSVIYMLARKDITTRRRVEADLRRRTAFQKALLDNAMAIIVSVRSDGLIDAFNARAEEALGYRSDEMVGKCTPEIFHDPEEIAARAKELSAALGREIAPGIDVFFTRPRQGLTEEREWTYVRRDGSRFAVQLSVSAMRDEAGQISGFLGVAQDITRRKVQENEIRQARDAALDSAKIKAEFLANISHEIRTPMNGIIGMTSLLLNTNLQPTQREFAETIGSSADVLLTLLNDILDFSKIEAGEMRFENRPFEFERTVKSAVDLMTARASARGIGLEVLVRSGVPPVLMGDASRLRQVLTNLVGNAVKFTERGDVTTEVRPVSHSEGSITLQFEVRDTGIGISPEAQRRLFQAFVQADGSTTRRFGGTGLGLAICKQLIERMGGEIGVQSQPGSGSVFWFTATFGVNPAAIPDETHPDTFPATPGTIPTAGNAAGAVKGKKSLRILIAEDNPVNQAVTKHQLQSLGYTADLAIDGNQALAMLAAESYDAVLMDCEMPGMDGYTASREIRKNEPGPSRIPIIALTAHSLAGDREKCLAAGMNDYLSKPVQLNELRDKLLRLSPETANDEDIRLMDERLGMLREQGGDELLSELVKIFIRHTPETMRRLRDAVEQGDAAALGAAAHSLKGSCANFGAAEMQCAAAEMERIVRENRLDAAPAVLADIEEAYRKVTIRLTPLISTSESC